MKIKMKIKIKNSIRSLKFGFRFIPKAKPYHEWNFSFSFLF